MSCRLTDLVVGQVERLQGGEAGEIECSCIYGPCTSHEVICKIAARIADNSYKCIGTAAFLLYMCGPLNTHNSQG